MTSQPNSKGTLQLQEEKKPTQDNSLAEEGPSREEIERRAHQIYLERGGVSGRDLDDWLQAERELKDPMTGFGAWNPLRKSVSDEIKNLNKEDLP
jgi:Protein of unknown function (DUF2934)